MKERATDAEDYRNEAVVGQVANGEFDERGCFAVMVRGPSSDLGYPEAYISRLRQRSSTAV
jgi:hypothetical protein